MYEYVRRAIHLRFYRVNIHKHDTQMRYYNKAGSGVHIATSRYLNPRSGVWFQTVISKLAQPAKSRPNSHSPGQIRTLDSPGTGTHASIGTHMFPFGQDPSASATATAYFDSPWLVPLVVQTLFTITLGKQQDIQHRFVFR